MDRNTKGNENVVAEVGLPDQSILQHEVHLSLNICPMGVAYEDT